MTLPDGIYVHPVRNGNGVRIIDFVVDGRASQVFPSQLGGHLPDDTSTWTRVADLPDLRMAEPQQIGYPVMATCTNSYKDAHLHIRSTDVTGWHWDCAESASTWSDLTDPRDLTPDEIAEHNLWTGGAS
jgi:hypothetical protein